MANGHSYRIAIIGGSIAGCTAAILMRKAGHQVEIFERSKRGLIGRGGGVTTTSDMLRQLAELDIIDEDFPSSPYSELHMSKVSDEDGDLGRCPLIRALDMNCVHWSGLWENMRKRIPDDIYKRGYELVSAENRDDDVVLQFQNGEIVTADLVLFADGYNSLGRKLMFPEIGLEYRGYSVWRGVVPESEIENGDQLSIHPRFSFRDQQGSFICYMIPDRDGSNEIGERQFNWACYLPVADAELAWFMTDKDGKQRTGTISAGSMRQDQDDELKALAKAQLPAYYSKIIGQSQNNQLQQIYTSQLPAYRKGRMCLIGDAGIMVQPLTGAGVFKLFSNARDLAHAITENSDLETALEGWSVEQTRIANSILSMGLDMEQAFIWNTIDLAKADPQECERWFDRSINIAKEYSYFAT
ncbi:FAD-dependent monooxygenase [Pararhizobium sp. IMCC21322]|uniref:FAD binding domain-containing protein n=1 Tax=Pararhizobium sp. IMCC21322 TaxID=3067903 RepID=UPI002740F3E2|nr:FAD-dependent monooxygenase [Pararhizobium sp. IMCC21322]